MSKPMVTMFTEQELNLIIQLADLAIRSQGLQAANTVLPLVGKCQALLASPPPDPESHGE
jgi:hypothetical protein